MLGDRFLKYLKSTPPRFLPRVNLFLSFLEYKINDATMRSTHTTPNSYGTRLLMDIIKLADLDTLLLVGDPYNRVGESLLSIIKDLEKPIDTRIGKHTTSSLFVKSKNNCFELIIPSRRKNPLSEIPINKSYDHVDWKSIKPLRIVDMGAADLTFNVYSDALFYHKHSPTHVIYTLDCFALVCKFIAYYRSRSSIINLDQMILNFLHSEIIIPTLLNDSVAIWLRNTYRQQLISSSPLESHSSVMWDNVNIDGLGTDFTGAMVDIQHIKRDLKAESITPVSFLSSLPLTISGTSFSDYYKELYETTCTSNQSPYAWADCLKNLEWWNFIILTCSHAPNLPESVSFQRDLLRDVRFWIMMKPYQQISGSIPYRNTIRLRLEGLYEYLRSR